MYVRTTTTTNSGCIVKYLYLCLAFWVFCFCFYEYSHASRTIYSMKRMSFVKVSPSVCFQLFAFAFAIFVTLCFDLISRKTDLFFFVVFMGFIELQRTTSNTTIRYEYSKQRLQKTKKAKLYIKNIITVFRKLCSFFLLFFLQRQQQQEKQKKKEFMKKKVMMHQNQLRDAL